MVSVFATRGDLSLMELSVIWEAKSSTQPTFISLLSGNDLQVAV